MYLSGTDNLKAESFFLGEVVSHLGDDPAFLQELCSPSAITSTNTGLVDKPLAT
jgi:hypothetical protein